MNILKLLIIILITGCGAQDQLFPRKDTQKTPPIPEEPTDGERQVHSDENPSYNSTLTNLEQILFSLGIGPGRPRGYRCEGLRIGILDRGFSGLENSRGVRLPPDIKVEPAPKNDLAESTHGTKLAEVVHSICSGNVNYRAELGGVELFLFNANGLTNLTDAVKQAIAKRIDIILYAQVWEYGGNRDGSGFINQRIKPAIDAGIVWVNAAGNYGKSSYSAKIVLNQGSNDLKLPYKDHFLRFRVPEDNTPVKISLGWNDFTNDMTYRTSQNLDLHLFNDQGTLLQEKTLIQDGKDHGGAPGYSGLARETIITSLPAGTYQLSVDAKSKNFTESSNSWLAIDGRKVEVLDALNADSLFMPNDLPGVISIGASDVDYSAFRLSEAGTPLKPDLKTVSALEFDDGTSITGTSAASAVAAAYLAVHMSAHGRLNGPGVLKAIKNATLGRLRPSLKSQGGRKDPLAQVPFLGTGL